MKLSEIKGKENIQKAVYKLLPLCKQIARNADIDKVLQEQKSYTAFLQAVIEYEYDAAVGIFAVLNEKNVEQYINEASAATIIGDLCSLLYDPELMALFGLPAPISEKTSSGAAGTSEEATSNKAK